MISPFKATPEYAESVFGLWISAKDAFRLGSSYSDPSRTEYYIAWLRRECAAGRVWIVTRDAATIGLAVMHPYKSEIWYLTVQAAQRKKGVGLAIVNRLQIAYSELQAQAQTPEVVRLLVKCGFADSGDKSKNGDPILTWTKA